MSQSKRGKGKASHKHPSSRTPARGEGQWAVGWLGRETVKGEHKTPPPTPAPAPQKGSGSRTTICFMYTPLVTRRAAGTGW